MDSGFVQGKQRSSLQGMCGVCLDIHVLCILVDVFIKERQSYIFAVHQERTVGFKGMRDR